MEGLFEILNIFLNWEKGGSGSQEFWLILLHFILWLRLSVLFAILNWISKNKSNLLFFLQNFLLNFALQLVVLIPLLIFQSLRFIHFLTSDRISPLQTTCSPCFFRNSSTAWYSESRAFMNSLRFILFFGFSTLLNPGLLLTTSASFSLFRMKDSTAIISFLFWARVPVSSFRIEYTAFSLSAHFRANWAFCSRSCKKLTLR